MSDQKGYYRDTWAEIDLDCIGENVSNMKRLLDKNVELMAVVKANGYGHGDVQVARKALASGASSLAVAFMDEALNLREKGITAPILILGATRPEDVNLAVKNNLILTIFQEEWIHTAKGYIKEDTSIKVHIKLDTGMGRIGVRDVDELKRLENLINQDDKIILDGVFTHFATADEGDLSYFNVQLRRFEEMLSSLSYKPRMIHASNSASALRRLPAHFNAIRFGISMYGLAPSQEIKAELPFRLKEAFSLRTKLIHVKKLSAGEKVSYGGTYEAKGEEWIGTLPIGYADGWIRKLQGQQVLLDGIRVPIVGRICMDQCMIKLPYRSEIGTIVTLIGGGGKDYIPIDEIADRLETINYEIPCLISNRVPRVYLETGKEKMVINSILQHDRQA